MIIKMKQKLEGVFSKSLALQTNLWYMKLQVNTMAHTRTPADYLIISEKYNYLVECKQVNIKNNPQARYNFDRLTQEQDLLLFENKFEKNKSYVLILFLGSMLKKSHFYLIPIKDYMKVKKDCCMKTLSHKLFHNYFENFIIKYETNRLKIEKLINK